MLTDNAPLNDVNVRRALKYGINRQELVDKIGGSFDGFYVRVRLKAEAARNVGVLEQTGCSSIVGETKQKDRQVEEEAARCNSVKEQQWEE